MKRYEEYKDSGIEWIGEIPSEWAVGKVGYYYNIQLGKMLQPAKKTQSDTLESYLCAINIGKECLKLDQIREMWFSSKEKEVYSIESGDLIVVEGGDVGTAIIYNGEIGTCYIQNALHRVRSYVSSNKFLLYWLAYLKVRGYIDLICSKATIAHFTKDKFSNTILLFPTITAQQWITDYLDHKTAAIDELIADKQKLVALLQEKRTAVISEAVTKGLDKNVEMKDSGVDWIGEIPNGWTPTKFKYFTSKIGSGKTPKGGNEVYADEGIVFVRSQNVYNAGLILDDVAYITADMDEDLANTRLAFNDVLLNVTGASIGRSCVWTVENIQGNVNQHVCIIRSSGNAIPQYIHYGLISNIGQTFIDSCQTGANRQGLNFEQIANFTFPLPMLGVQQTIVTYLNKKTAQIDSLIFDINEQIEKLKEYRQTVISEAVTGKVTV